MKRIILATILSALMAATAYAGVVSSDPDFKRDGKRAYTCFTPSGKKVKCNRWQFHREAGWKKRCGLPKKNNMFDKLANRHGRHVDIRTPDSRCAAMYDAIWADHRDWSAPDWLTEERFRPLKEASFEQFVKVETEGMYEFRACMAANFYIQADEPGLIMQGGISAMLEQLHADRPTETLAQLPEKANFKGGGATWEEASHGVTWVDTYQDLPTGERRDVYGVRTPEFDIYVHDGRRWLWVGSAQYNYYQNVDGYEGHAGLRTAYYGVDVFDTPEAIWTCHSKFMALPVGTYVMRGYTFETQMGSSHNGPVSLYDGWGAIRTMFLRHLVGEEIN